MKKWITKLVDKEVEVNTRNQEEVYTGTLLDVDITPLGSGMGATAVLEKDDGTLLVAFDVETIEELHPDD